MASRQSIRLQGCRIKMKAQIQNITNVYDSHGYGNVRPICCIYRRSSRDICAESPDDPDLTDSVRYNVPFSGDFFSLKSRDAIDGVLVRAVWNEMIEFRNAFCSSR